MQNMPQPLPQRFNAKPENKVQITLALLPMYWMIFFLFLFLVYAFLILFYYRSWRLVPSYTGSRQHFQTRLSVIVPARNEEACISALLTALAAQTYPRSLYEVIVVDDHSSDGTSAEVKKFSWVQLIRLADEGINSYKKKAIEKGIAAATGTLIVTTDADCVPPPGWLAALAGCYEGTRAAFIAAPVVISNGRPMVEIFQAMDFLVLQGITAASVHRGVHAMCNGANLAYTREAFEAVEGFRDIDDIASGDDMLLMQKFRERYPSGIVYLKAREAIVPTAPVSSWKAFFHQRIRWASKSTHYRDARIKAVLLIVYLFNLSLLVCFIAALAAPVYWWWLLGGLLAKTLTELPFFAAVARFYNKTALIKYFPLFQPLHILYTVTAGFLGLLGRYEWKGRKVK